MKSEVRNPKSEESGLLRPFRAWPVGRENPGRRSFLALPWAGLLWAFGPSCFDSFIYSERFNRNLRVLNFGFRISDFGFFLP